jgi:hypothetical protein
MPSFLVGVSSLAHTLIHSGRKINKYSPGGRLCGSRTLKTFLRRLEELLIEALIKRSKSQSCQKVTMVHVKQCFSNITK